MNKLLFFSLLFYLHIASVYSDIIKPNTKIKPYNVVEIQLISLKNNDKPDKDFGIEQTWEFAHPENKINTGPLNNFKKMLKNEIYSILLNHKEHKIEEIYNNKKIAIYDVIILGSDNFYYEFKWQVERYDGKGSLNNCWLTTAVSNPVSLGASI